MALKPCRECGESVSTSAKVCPHCGVSAPTTNPTRNGILAGGLILFLAFLCARSGGDDTTAVPGSTEASSLSPTTEGGASRGELESQMQRFIETGLVKRVDLDARDVYVDGFAWSQIPYDMKERFGQFAGEYMKAVSPAKIGAADIRDYQSGKQLAEQDAFGFSVE